VVVIGPAEPVIESKGIKYPAFLNPYGTLVTQLDYYLAYSDENHFLEDHKRYRSWKEAVLCVIDQITLFLDSAIEYARVIGRKTE